MDAGGDIMSGSALQDGSPWPIAIGDPFQPENDLEMLYLAGEGVATSGQDYRFWNLNGTRIVSYSLMFALEDRQKAMSFQRLWSLPM